MFRRTMLLFWVAMAGRHKQRIKSRDETFRKRVSDHAYILLDQMSAILSNDVCDDKIYTALRRNVADYVFGWASKIRLSEDQENTAKMHLLIAATLLLLLTAVACAWFLGGGIPWILWGTFSFALSTIIVAMTLARLNTRWQTAVAVFVYLIQCVPLFYHSPNAAHSDPDRFLASVLIGVTASGIFGLWTIIVRFVQLYIRVIREGAVGRKFAHSTAMWSIAEAWNEIAHGYTYSDPYYFERQSSYVDWQSADLDKKNKDLASAVTENAIILRSDIHKILSGNFPTEDSHETLKRQYVLSCAKRIRRLHLSLWEALDPIGEHRYLFPNESELLTKVPLNRSVERCMKKLRLVLHELSHKLLAPRKYPFSEDGFLASHLKTCQTAIDELLQSLKEANHQFTSSLAYISLADFRLQAQSSRNLIISKLEDAARSLDLMPANLLAKDPFHSAWDQRAYSERAAAIRDLKKWVLLPLDCTRRDLEAKLRSILYLLAEGNWGALNRLDLPSQPPLPFWTRISHLARAILLALVPLAFVAASFFVVKRLGGSIPASLQQWAPTVAVGWAAISLLSLLDPRFSEKIALFKDWPKVLLPGSKQDEEASKR